MANSSIHVLASMTAKLRQHSDLGAGDVSALLNLPHRVTAMNPGDYLVRDGDKVHSCNLLLTGYVYRSKVSGNGARQILSIHMRGDLMDLQNSVLGQADHSAQAMTQVSVASISHQEILKVSDSFPGVARALWRDTLVDGSICREWILNVGQRNARERITHLLCELVVRQQAAGICQGPVYELPMTQPQIGDATGLTPVHVNRTMQGMRRDGLITISKGSVTIPDWHELQAKGDFSRAYLHIAPPHAL
jgi:CRP-like cAMP-binding protein